MTTAHRLSLPEAAIHQRNSPAWIPASPRSSRPPPSAPGRRACQSMSKARVGRPDGAGAVAGYPAYQAGRLDVAAAHVVDVVTTHPVNALWELTA